MKHPFKWFKSEPRGNFIRVRYTIRPFLRFVKNGVLVFTILYCVEWKALGQMPPMNSVAGYSNTNIIHVGVYSVETVAEGSTQAEAVADSQIAGYMVQNGQTNLAVGDSQYPQFIVGHNYTVEFTPDGYAHLFPNLPSVVWSSDLITYHCDRLQITYGPWLPAQFFINL